MNNEELILYRLDELKEDISKIDKQIEEANIDIARIKTEIEYIKEDIAEIKNKNKKDSNNSAKRYDYLLAVVALGSSLIALAMAFIKK